MTTRDRSFCCGYFEKFRNTSISLGLGLQRRIDILNVLDQLAIMILIIVVGINLHSTHAGQHPLQLVKGLLTRLETFPIKRANIHRGYIVEPRFHLLLVVDRARIHRTQFLDKRGQRQFMLAVRQCSIRNHLCQDGYTFALQSGRQVALFETTDHTLGTVTEGRVVSVVR